MLKGKCVVIGVTGSIAAYKAASLASLLVKAGANVQVIMTRNATEFINPVTFETLTGRKCLTDTFDRNFEYKVEHISLAKEADVFVIAPATANVIAKIACGLADDMLTTTFLAAKCPKIVAPAMNTQMLENPVTQNNLNLCRKYGMTVLESAEGRLACGDCGKGKLPEPEYIFECIEHEIGWQKDLLGKKVLITAGPTREALDPVRYITNHSTGKMGYALAKVASARGAEVTLVSGPVNLEKPPFVRVENVVSAADMAPAVKACFAESDIVIKAAAVADYRPSSVSDHKIKKSDGDMAIPLERTEDILAYLGDNRKPGQTLCGFSMETQDMVENSRAKLIKKHVDLIVANNLKTPGSGFGTDTNVVTLIDSSGVKELPIMSKEDVASAVLDRIIEIRGEKNAPN